MPRVTIGILSWDRLHYLRATVESARRSIQYPNLEWIISDNESKEPGLRAYIDGLEWVQHKLFRRQSHAEAMNEMVRMATGEFLMIWPDDVQFTVAGDWMTDVVDLLRTHTWIGTMGLNSLRRLTYSRLLTWRAWLDWRGVLSEVKRHRIRFRRQRILASRRGARFCSFGWVWPGVVGSGIPSICRTETWRMLGPWRSTRGSGGNLIDSSLGAEDDMVERWLRSGVILQQAMPIVPVAADIVTDPSGSKAKVRGGRRYGVYFPPPEGTYYYRIRSQEDFLAARGARRPLAFEECVEPIGFTLPLDARGNLLKASTLNTAVVCDV